MIIDQRTYTLKPNILPEYLEFYEERGFPIQTRHLGEPLGWFYSDIGELNQIVHMWRYKDYADRQERRTNMVADPEWSGFLKDARPYLVKMTNKILIPTSFSPIR